jgi:hypothetical protein
MKKKLAVTLFTVLFMLTSPLWASVGDSLAFSGNIAEMKGHLDMAVFNLKQGERELAEIHAGHPVEEYWILIGEDIKKRDLELFQSLDRELLEVHEMADTASVEEFETKVNDVSTLLDKAEALVVPLEIRIGFIYKIRVALSLLETAESEYEVGVSESGEVKEIAEYQDSIAFVNRAKKIYQEIRSAVDEHEAEEIDEFFEELIVAMTEKQAPSKVETFLKGIIHEFQEVADIEVATEEEKGPLGYIETIEMLLPELVHEYAEGGYEEADELAVKAYLDNFEFVEGPLGSIDPELNEELEHLLREELRELIRNRAPADEVEAMVREIGERLETAEGLLSGETPAVVETSVAQPEVKVEKPNMALWYGVVAVLLVVAIAEGATIYKLKGGGKKE